MVYYIIVNVLLRLAQISLDTFRYKPIAVGRSRLGTENWITILKQKLIGLYKLERTLRVFSNDNSFNVKEKERKTLTSPALEWDRPVIG